MKKCCRYVLTISFGNELVHSFLLQFRIFLAHLSYFLFLILRDVGIRPFSIFPSIKIHFTSFAFYLKVELLMVASPDVG